MIGDTYVTSNVWKDVKEAFFTFHLFLLRHSKVNLRTSTYIFINLRLLLILQPSVLFLKNLHSAARKFTYSAVCGNTYTLPSTPPPTPSSRPHNGSNYYDHFIVNDLAGEFEKELKWLGENTEVLYNLYSSNRKRSYLWSQ